MALVPLVRPRSVAVLIAPLQVLAVLPMQAFPTQFLVVLVLAQVRRVVRWVSVVNVTLTFLSAVVVARLIFVILLPKALVFLKTVPLVLKVAPPVALA